MDAAFERADWYEVYDNEQVQLLTRQRVSRLSIAFVLGLCVLLGLVPALLIYLPSTAAVLGVVLLGAVGLFALSAYHMLGLRRVVWCIKLSVHRVVGYDYARRKTVLPWPDIERLDVDDQGMLIVGAPQQGRPGPILRIPILFPDFARLSHRLVEYAEAHRVPVCIGGRPWQLLDLSTLYPFMAAIPVAERPEGPCRDSDDTSF
jgi:hypothetical protein